MYTALFLGVSKIYYNYQVAPLTLTSNTLSLRQKTNNFATFLSVPTHLNHGSKPKTPFGSDPSSFLLPFHPHNPFAFPLYVSNQTVYKLNAEIGLGFDICQKHPFNFSNNLIIGVHYRNSIFGLNGCSRIRNVLWWNVFLYTI
jgi:hypothetical protein